MHKITKGVDDLTLDIIHINNDIDGTKKSEIC